MKIYDVTRINMLDVIRDEIFLSTGAPKLVEILDNTDNVLCELEFDALELVAPLGLRFVGPNGDNELKGNVILAGDAHYYRIRGESGTNNIISGLVTSQAGSGDIKFNTVDGWSLEMVARITNLTILIHNSDL